jgi:hypothetical protein
MIYEVCVSFGKSVFIKGDKINSLYTHGYPDILLISQGQDCIAEFREWIYYKVMPDDFEPPQSTSATEQK